MVTAHCKHWHGLKIPEGSTVPFNGKHTSWSFTTPQHPRELVLDGHPVQVKYVDTLKVTQWYRRAPIQEVRNATP